MLVPWSFNANTNSHCGFFSYKRPLQTIGKLVHFLRVQFTWQWQVLEPLWPYALSRLFWHHSVGHVGNGSLSFSSLTHKHLFSCVSTKVFLIGTSKWPQPISHRWGRASPGSPIVIKYVKNIRERRTFESRAVDKCKPRNIWPCRVR